MKVKFENVTKRYGDFIAVDNLTAEFNDGELVALLGPSGCGKTTTLLMLAGVYKPNEGNLIFGDKIVNSVPAKNRHLGMCFQSYALYPHMTVFENVAFPLKIAKVSKPEIEERVTETLKRVEISHLADRKPGQLSGGQQQRVSLARALVKNPTIMLLDEPLSNLDARLRITMRGYIKKLQKDMNLNMVLVTHDQTEALSMADRILIMNNGVLQDFNTPEELYERPKNFFIANFIGSPPMNFLDLDITDTKEGIIAVNENDSVNIKLPKELEKKFDFENTGKAIKLGIRPESLSIKEFGTTGIGGEIYIVEPMGRDKLVEIMVGNKKVKVLAPNTFTGDIGDKVSLEIDYSKIHLFNQNTELTLRRSI